MLLETLSDVVSDLIMGWELKGIKPSSIIIGKLEYDLIIDDIRKHPTFGAPLTSYSQEGVSILGVPVVFDPDSNSRITLTYPIGIRTDCLIKRKMGKDNK